MVRIAAAALPGSPSDIFFIAIKTFSSACRPLVHTAVTPGTALDSTGTATSIVMPSAGYLGEHLPWSSGLACYAHVAPGLYVVRAGLKASGGAVAWLVLLWALHLTASPVGRVLRAVHGDEEAAARVAAALLHVAGSLEVGLGDLAAAQQQRPQGMGVAADLGEDDGAVLEVDRARVVAQLRRDAEHAGLPAQVQELEDVVDAELAQRSFDRHGLRRV